jgi:hypothetical protein
MSVLDVFATFDTAIEDGDGNTIGLIVTDPLGNKYSSGIALPVLDAPSREVVVKNPVAGRWLLEVRGVRGLAAAPEVSLPTSGAAAPGPVEVRSRSSSSRSNPSATYRATRRRRRLRPSSRTARWTPSPTAASTPTRTSRAKTSRGCST